MKNQKFILFKLRSSGLMAVLAFSLITFSTTASATKVKFLFAPGGLLSATNEVNTRTSGYNHGGTRTTDYGFGVAVDFGNGPHTFAFDFYDNLNNILASESTITASFFNNAAQALETSTGTLKRQTDHIAEAILLGYRWHHKNGFYVGGGAMFIQGRSISNSVFIPFSTNERAFVDGTPVLSNDYKQALTPALTIGYDYTFKNNLLIGVHFMRSLPTTIKDKTIFNNPSLEDFYVQSINLGIGYKFGPTTKNREIKAITAALSK
ncbi:MAG: hypothetical protein HAW61_02565 [Candidatus Portiera sp.]|nr:hypothetical protein [Portiera sp.]